MLESGIKRRRLVLSCFECKRRKLKCGRQIPVCSRCIDVGHPELCKYDPRFSMGVDVDMDIPDSDYYTQPPLPNNFHDHQLAAPAFGGFDISLSLNDNCHSNPLLHVPFGLDLGLGGSSCENESLSTGLLTDISGGEDVSNPPEAQGQQQAPTGGSKSFNGRFRGPSHSMSILASFQGLPEFLRKTVQDHHILGVLKWGTHTARTEQPFPSYSKDKVELAMKHLLPAEKQCNRLAKSYFDHFTGIYGLFHVPTFWQEYERYWSGTHSDSVRFNAILLAVMSCSRCLFVEDPLSFEGDSSSARNEARQWLHAVETWQGYQTAKDATLESFQIRFLVLFSKTLNDIERKDHYTESQTFLADAISNGLHRDWKVLGVEESIFERELRRKIWSAVAELDIARCLERGVPSMAANLFADIGQPKGCNEGDYNETTESEPQDQPDSQLTDNSFTRFAHSIRPLRYNINDFVNNPHKQNSLSQSKLLALHQQICKALEDIPDWSDPAPGVAGRNQGLTYRAVLELYLHELLLLLHLPFALGKNSTVSGDADYQKFICVKSASTIIKIYQMLAGQGFSQIALPKANLLRAGLCLCLFEADVLNYGVKTSLPISPISGSNLVESALVMLEQRVLSLGTDLQSLWIFSAASCYTESYGDPISYSAWKRRITDNIVVLFTKMCLTQKDKNLNVGFYDTHLARYIMQIQQACDDVGLMTDST